MKKLFEIFQKLRRSQKIQTVISILLIIIAAGMVILEIIGIQPISIEKQLDLIIGLLCSIVLIYILDTFDIGADSNEKLGGLCSNVEYMKADIRTIIDALPNINLTRDIIASRTDMDKKYDIEELWSEASEIDLLAIANTSFLGGNGIGRLVSAANQGTKIKLVCLNPDSPLLQEYIDSKIISNTSLPLEENINAYINKCKEKRSDETKQKRRNIFKQNVELRVTNFLLPYSMMIVKHKTKGTIIKIDLYGVNIDFMDRRSFWLNDSDNENIDYYLNQWESVWGAKDKTVKVALEKLYVTK